MKNVEKYGVLPVPVGQNLRLTLTLILSLVFLGLGLGLVFWLGLGFVLLMYSAGQKYLWIIFPGNSGVSSFGNFLE